MLGWQKKLTNDITITFTWSGYNLQSRYKWEPDFVSEVLHWPLPSNSIRYVGVTKGFHCICQVTLVQFAGQVQTEDSSWCLRFHIHYYLQTFFDMLGWQQNFTCDIFKVVTWLWYNLQTMYKMKTRYSISGSTHTVAFKLCQISWEEKRISLIM